MRRGISVPVRFVSAAALVALVAGSRGVEERAAAASARLTGLNPTLLRVDAAAATRGEAAALDVARAAAVPVEGDEVVVEARGGAGVEAAVVRAGGTVERRWRDFVLAQVPPSGLRELAAGAGVEAVREAVPIVYATHEAPPAEPGSGTSEGVSATGAPAWHWAGYAGAGVKVAVIDHFADYRDYQARGDLPREPQLVTKDLCDRFEKDEHGSAVAAVVHDMAPDAELHLICADFVTDLGAAVDYAISEGVDVIALSGGVHNGGPNDGTGDGTSPEAAVARARANGILWVNAAGNQAEAHWSGTFVDDDGDGVHEFAPGVEEANVSGFGFIEFCAYLRWDDWPLSNQDYDLELLRDGTRAKISRERQNGTFPPGEKVCWDWHADDTWQLRITRHQATATPRMDLVVVDAVLEPSRREPMGSLIAPAGSPDALAVGAICWQDRSLLPYSSRGPNPRGLVKPDLAAPTNVTVFEEKPAESCGEGGFSGTSAATPHVAGAAALVKQAHPVYGPNELQAFLEARAVDLGAPGKDNFFGAGALSLGEPPPPADGPERRRGDIFVGTSIGQDAFGGHIGGKVVRVRGGSVVDYCRSPLGPEPGVRWPIPSELIVDSFGNVVFAAVTANGIGLFRCEAMGAPARLLAMLASQHSSPAPGQPDPFPDLRFEGVSGLHLARVKSIAVDGAGVPETITEDAYVFAAALWNAARGRYALKTLRLRATTEVWDEGPEPVQLFATQANHAMPDLANWGGFTYSGNQGRLRRSKEALAIRFGNDVHLAFGGYKELGAGGAFPLDNLRIPNIPSGCAAHPDNVALEMPFDGGDRFLVPEITGLVYAPSAGLVLRSNSTSAGWPYFGEVSEALLDDDPSNDDPEHFHQGLAGCAHVPSLKGVSLLPFSASDGSGSNDVWQLASGPYGLVGTQGNEVGEVVAVAPGDKVSTIVDEGLFFPRGIAAYPPDVPEPSGRVVTVRIDSPVDVAVVDSDGRRLGVVDGRSVNDFGNQGYDSGPGEPRVLAIKNPHAGKFSLDFVGTGSGSYTITVYSSDLSKPVGGRISVSGTIAPGQSGEHDFTLEPDGAVAFDVPPAPVDTTPPVIASRVTPDANAAGWHRQPVTVSWEVGDPESGIASANGCSAVELTDDTGGFTVACIATNGAGLESAARVTVRIDRTPPTISGARSPAANVDGWTNRPVTVTFTCADALSGVTSCSPPVTVSGEGTGQSVTGSASDLAGNVGTATVTGISIDKTAPEAAVQYDVKTKDLEVLARDDLSGPAVGGAAYTLLPPEDEDERRRYVVFDRAGNERAVVIEVEREHDGAELTARLERFPDNKLVAEVDAYGLEQKIELGKGAEKETVKARYDGSKTTITVQRRGSRVKETKPGLVLLRLVTAGAAVRVEY